MDQNTVDSRRRVYKPSIFKQALAWFMIAGAGGCHLALDVWLIKNWSTQPSQELWSALAISVVLILLVLLGVSALRSYFVLSGDTIEIVNPLGSKRFHVSELGGFGRITIVVNMVPMHQIRLYGFGLKAVGAISLSRANNAEIDQWFQARLPLVVDEGSLAIPKPRYADARGAQRDPTLRGA